VGGGTELALACHGRVGTDHPRFQIGLPEVNLGLYPAWGGTTRLPRLVGLQQSLELILTGRTVNARKALKIGLINKAVPHQQVHERAVELLRELSKKDWRKPKRRRAPGFLGWLLEGNPLGRRVVFRQARKTVMARSHGHYPAPLKALDVIRRAWKMPLQKALELEAEEAGDLIVSPISKSLIHLFFLSEKAKKDTGVEGNIPAKDFDRTGLLGAGTMGGGIAWLFSYRDIPVRVKDLNAEAIGAGMKEAYRLLDKRRKRRRMTPWERDKKMTLISPTLDWSGFKLADVVIEAIVEDLEIKKKVLRELEPEVTRDCVIGSNTSTLPITDLQSVLEHPERMAGFHFFNPVERMPLIEVIRGQQTSDETVASLVAFAKRVGKTPVVVNDCPGFLVNRILGPYLNEASYLLLETGDLKGIDKALLDFGMPMGPLRLLDEVGIDVAQKASKVLSEAYGAPSAGVIDKLVKANRLGKKTNRGLYRHQGKKEQPDFDVLSVVGVDQRRSVVKREAVERCVYPMVAEAARCLDEDVVRSPGDLDLAMVMGTGFPPFRGGLLRFADAEGLSTIVDGLRKWQDKFGERFESPPALVDRARSGRGFYDGA
jgi:3-hydroxyacyl-CoA dehydrogenase/enoyl-CoA hydratase/3-hydroxybutyryl-CoA epimerase